MKGLNEVIILICVSFASCYGLYLMYSHFDDIDRQVRARSNEFKKVTDCNPKKEGGYVCEEKVIRVD